MKVGKVKEASSGREDMSVLSKIYLMFYNGIQTVGWSYVLFKTVNSLIYKPSTLWLECSTSVTIFQNLALLEVVHCLLGLVPSSALMTFVQIFSRVYMIWGILVPFKEAQASPTLAFMMLAWSITEVIRYSYYLTNLIGITPRILTWFRYSLFIVLYPIGVTGEMGNIYYALDMIKRSKFFSLELPNKLNISFSFYYFCLFTVFSYVPIFPQLYSHMLRQRRKMLGYSESKEFSQKTK